MSYSRLGSVAANKDASIGDFGIEDRDVDRHGRTAALSPRGDITPAF
jgi:hypothetical protein